MEHDYELETVFTYVMRSDTVEIIYLHYEGGGECWEWRIIRDGKQVIMSDDGYGSPEPAARDAFGWLVDN